MVEIWKNQRPLMNLYCNSNPSSWPYLRGLTSITLYLTLRLLNTGPQTRRKVAAETGIGSCDFFYNVSGNVFTKIFFNPPTNGESSAVRKTHRNTGAWISVRLANQNNYYRISDTIQFQSLWVTKQGIPTCEKELEPLKIASLAVGVWNHLNNELSWTALSSSMNWCTILLVTRKR